MPESTVELKLSDEAATAALGQSLARALQPPPAAPVVIYLQGPLGAGKTCVARSLLRELGVKGTVRSPTYTLLEIYEAGGVTVAHLDLYRLNSAEELEALGLREMLEPGFVWLVEWAERGVGHLPQADLEIELAIDDDRRVVWLRARNEVGSALLKRLPCASERPAD